jgi:coenzyme F420-0:L-glutamate ligase/coenzyme F420-1:gamma-L-glutamate ligase
MLTAFGVEGIGEISAGFDLAHAVVEALGASPPDGAAPSGPGALAPGDVLVIAHKAISKSEGRTRRLSEVDPSPRAREIAGAQEKDPRLVQVVLDESRAVLRASHGVLITETHHGFVCANSGVDASNVEGEDTVLMLPRDPDASARRIRARLMALTGVSPGVVVTDSFGRAWRTGQCDITIGCAGIEPLEDWRGHRDLYGRELHATIIAVADQMAALADLARRKDGRQPVVLIRGAERHVTRSDGPGVAPLLREPERDLFR